MSKKNNSPKRKMYLLFSGKGGVGKTTWSRSFLDYARTNNHPLVAFDADREVQQLVTYYGLRDANGELLRGAAQDPRTGVGYFDIKNIKEAGLLINMIENPDYAGHDFLIDLPGGSLTNIKNILGNAAEVMEVLADNDIQPVIVTVITPFIGSLRSIELAVNNFGPTVKHIFVRNLQASSGTADWPLFDATETYIPGNVNYQQLCQKHGLIVDMPELYFNTYALLDLYNMPFSKAAEDTRMLLVERRRVKNFNTDTDGLHQAVINYGNN